MFIYTILASSSVNFFMDPAKLRGIGLQNVYASSAFIFFIFLCNQNILSGKNYKIVLILSLIVFIVGNYNYINSRKERIIELKTKENILHSKINQIIKSYKTLVVYSDIGYGFGDFTILGRGNSIFAGEKFNNELIDAYPNHRYFRMHDVIFKLENRNFNINRHVLKVDDLIKKYFPKSLQLIFSPNSLNITTPWIGSPLRSKEMFIKKNNADKIEGIVLNSILIKNNLPALKEYIKNESKLKNYKEIKIDNDTWYIFY
jgi:hypothetical protein